MRAYEAMIIFDATLDDAGLQEAAERVGRLIADQGGVIDRINPWGKRRLAYELDGHHEGIYIVLNFHAEQKAVAELERVLRLNERVLRHIVVHQEEPPAAEAEEGSEEGVPAAEPGAAETGAASEPAPTGAANPSEG